MHVAVTAVGADRPGIVAAVTKVLFDQGANIEDSRMAILGGHFAMVLIVSTPADAAALEDALGAPAAALGLVCSVRPVADAPGEHTGGAPWVVSVYGADRPGIVWRVSQLLADRRVNIIDLATHVIEGDPPVYVMILEVTLPAGADEAAIDGELKSLAGELGIDVSMRPVEPETL